MKMKRIKIRARDRLSELPDSLIFNIFRSLPMTDVVRTTVLSKRWNNLWTTLPWLDFSNRKMIFSKDIDKFRNFVDGAVNSWRGTKIMSFNLVFRCPLEEMFSIGDDDLDDSLIHLADDDIDSWIHFAIEKRVETLKLYLPNVQCLKPQHLYSCSSLKSLSLTNCNLEIHGNVEWIHLERLTIHGEDIAENAINRVLAGSPKLVYFYLTLHGNKQNLSIRSSSLKWLCVRQYLCDDGSASTDTELRISTPKLETLQILGVPYSKCLLMDVSSLIQVSYKLDGGGIYTTDFVVERLSLFLPIFENVRKVALSQWCIKVLGAAKKKHKLPSFPNLYFLVVEVWYGRCELILDVFEMFPNLRNLAIETTLQGLLTNHPKFERNLPPDLLLLQLRTIHVIWRDVDDSIFPLIQILLKHAIKLETLVFSPAAKGKESPTSWRSLFLASSKLLKMQRASPTAELIFG